MLDQLKIELLIKSQHLANIVSSFLKLICHFFHAEMLYVPAVDAQLYTGMLGWGKNPLIVSSKGIQLAENIKYSTQSMQTVNIWR